MNQQEHQELKSEIEELKLAVEVRDLSLKELQTSFSKFSGHGKALISEENLFRSKSMETLSTQVRYLLDEVEKRENLEIQLADTQAKLKASLNERKMMSSFRASMDEVESEVGVLRAQNRELQDKLSRMQHQASLGQSSTTQE